MNRDGFDDLIVGNGNDAYVIFGRDFTNQVEFLGTAGDDTLTGTAGDEILIGGQGHDILSGGGGVDTLIGGAGDDRLGIGDSGFQRVDGGSGLDNLVLETTDMDLDLTMIANNRVEGIETIDMTGAGSNTLTLELSDILDTSDSTDPLTILGDASDAVVADLSGQGFTSSLAAGFTVYTDGLAELIVNDLVDQAGIIL